MHDVGTVKLGTGNRGCAAPAGMGTLLILLALLIGCGQWLPTTHAVDAPRSSCWPKVREQYEQTHPTCEACGGKQGLQTHHVIAFKARPDLECDPNNLIRLCTNKTHNCHLWLGHCGDFARWFNPNVRDDAKRFRDMLAKRQPNEPKVSP